MPLYRIDYYQENEHGQPIGYTDWMGGPTIANVKNVPLFNGPVDLKEVRAVRVTGEPLHSSAFPGQTSYKGKTVKGALIIDDTGKFRFNIHDPSSAT